MTQSPVFLPAIGLINGLGATIADIRRHLFAGDGSGLVREFGWLAGGGEALVGKVTTALPSVPPRLARYDCRNNRLLLAALAQIATAVEAAIARFGRARVGIVLGTSTSGIAEGEAAIAALRLNGSLPADFDYAAQEIGTAAPFLAAHLGLTGPAYTVSTACTSSAKALISARRLIASGLCDAVIAGGADSLSRLTVSGFTALESMSQERCNPMSVNRCGINIGEGAALFLVSRNESDIALIGCGESSDAFHLSAPEPEGWGAETAMRSALMDAGVTPGDIAYVNLHGTATAKNDEMESRAMARVFPQGVPASSTKPLTGHLLGAAGATEAAFCWMSLSDDRQRLPPHLWDGQNDPQLPSLKLVEPGDTFARHSRCHMMSNGFAFGGSNACLILGDAP